MKYKIPDQRWKFRQPDSDLVDKLVKNIGLSPIMAQIVINRGFTTVDSANIYVNPEAEKLPSPLQEFQDLSKSIELLQKAIATNTKIAICGDYDADGMTSTALLIRALRHLGADVNYAIPSRMKDGYGINERIVEEFAREGIKLILTVDNGISAFNPISRAKELGLQVIITDHHDLPEKLPPADAILNPKLLPKTSPYWGIAGVGVAYILAVSLAQSLDQLDNLNKPLLELFTVGTIADLAPLIGVNRRWLKRGLKLLPFSEITGIKALNQLCGLDETKKQLNSDDIGFKIGPRINAVGRIGDPQNVIELLTTEDEGVALEKAMICNQNNTDRQNLCKQIEQEAINLVEKTPLNYQEDWVLIVIGETWHHGVIGIVASRLVERYGVPVFIGTYEDENKEIIRGSARGIEEFNVFYALQYCDDLLNKYGGHKAAGGFNFPAKNLELLKRRLSEFCHQTLAKEYLKPLVKIDAQLTFQQANLQLLAEIDKLYPWGTENNTPVFWTPNVRVISSKATNSGDHLQLILADQNTELKGIAWGWSRFAFLPSVIDVAYKLKENEWQGIKSIQLEIIGIRNSQTEYKQTEINLHNRQYICSLSLINKQLKIINSDGKELHFTMGDSKAYIDNNIINLEKEYFYENLINTALNTLNKI